MQIPKDQILAALNRVPRPVREFVMSDELTVTATKLAQKYQLHTDTTGTLVEILTNTLLGLIRPEDMTKVLMDALMLEQSVAGSLITDINTLVFMPLQKSVREAVEAERLEHELEEEESEPEAEVPVQAPPSKPAPLPPPALDYAPPQTLPGSPVPAPMPPVTQPVTPVVAAAPASLEPAYPQPVPQQHFVHTMPHAAVQQGWHPAAAVHIYVPSHGNPLQQAPQQVTEHITPSVPVQEQVSQAPVAPAPVPPPSITEPAPIAEAPAPSMPPAKPRTADPYRESI